MRKLSKETIFLLFIALNPILDIIYSITEYYLKISLPINQGMRVGFILYCIWAFNIKKYYKYIFALSGILLINEITYLVRGLNFNLLSNFAYDAKLMSFFIFIIVTYELLLSNRIKINEVVRCIIISIVIICSGIIIPTLLGVGMDTYSGTGRFGIKGLFNAQNAITATLLIQLPVILLGFKSLKKRVLFSIFIIAVLVLNLVGTKVGTIGSIFIIISCIIFYLIHIFREKINFKYLMKLVYSAIGTIALLIIIAYKKIILFLNNLPYDKMEFPTFFSYLVSNRDAQIRILHNYVVNDNKRFYDLFFGLGFTQGSDVLKNTGIGFQLIEMDFNGIYYYSGLFVLLIFLSVFIYTIYINTKVILIDRNIEDVILGISLIVGTGHALLGGHVLYEAITNFYLAIIIGIILYKNTKIKLNNNRNISSKKNKILFISWTLSAGGGVETILSKLVNGMVNKGYDISLFEYINFGKDEKIYPNEVKRLKSILKYPSNDTWINIKIFSVKEKILDNLVRFAPKLFRKIFLVGEYDIEIACTYLTPSFILVNKKNRKNIIWIHGPLDDFIYKNKRNVLKKIKSFYLYKRQKKALELSSDIVVISNKVYQSVVSVYPEYREKIIKIYNGYDIQWIEEKANKENIIFGVPTIISVGRLDKNKNHKLLIETCNKLKEKRIDFKAVIIGEGEERRNLENLISELELEGYVELYGYKSNPYPYIKAANIFFMGSFSEGFPTVIAEAMTLKIPIIMTKVSGSEELTQNGECGIIIDREINAATDAILELVSESSNRTNIINKAYENIKEYSIEKQVNEFLILCNKKV